MALLVWVSGLDYICRIAIIDEYPSSSVVSYDQCNYSSIIVRVLHSTSIFFCECDILLTNSRTLPTYVRCVNLPL